MNLPVRELMFYGGIAAAAASLLLLLLYLCISRHKSARLNAQLEKEYGPPVSEQ